MAPATVDTRDFDRLLESFTSDASIDHRYHDTLARIDDHRRFTGRRVQKSRMHAA